MFEDTAGLLYLSLALSCRMFGLLIRASVLRALRVYMHSVNVRCFKQTARVKDIKLEGVARCWPEGDIADTCSVLTRYIKPLLKVCRLNLEVAVGARAPHARNERH